jgi:hypothetical protein
LDGLDLDALHYLDEIVEPTIVEFEREPSSVRRALIACMVTYHAIDYLYSKSERRNALTRLRGRPEFALIERVANAAKHAIFDGRPRLPVENILWRPPARAGALMCGLSQIGDGEGGVTVWGERGMDILPAVRRTAEFIRGNIVPPNSNGKE